MSISLKGFHDRFVTLLAGASCTVGSPVNITAENTASDCAAGGFAGVCAARDGDLALVQVTGFVTLPADAAAPALGFGRLEAAAGGKVKNGAAGRDAIVTAVADGQAELVLL